MKPDQAYAELVACSRGAAPAQVTEAAVVDDTILPGINRSYFQFRRWIAFVALGMPVLLVVGGLFFAGPAECPTLVPQAALSVYYHCLGGWLRDVFVGSLCVIGFALFCYKGYTKTENLVLDLAAVCAVLVALVPMAPGKWPDRALPRWVPEPLFEIGNFPVGLHALAAVGLFVAVAYVCIVESGKTLARLNDEAAKRNYRRAYLILGVAMVALPLGVVALHALTNPENSRVIFFVEYAGVAVFAIYWLVKSSEIARILKQPPRNRS